MKVNSKLMGFGAGTKVLMADGKYKAIENIKTGDYVLSFNQLDAYAPLEPKKVLDTYVRLDRNPLQVKVFDTDIELTVAPGQLFITPGSDWKEATKINELIDQDGNVHSFDVKQINRGKHQIYDIIVEDNHSLIANGLRVHNLVYTVADVIAGRNLAGSNIQSGPISNYYRQDDLENSNAISQQGTQRKKKRSRKTDYRTEPKIDGLVAAKKLLSSVEDLTDAFGEILDETSPTNLTSIKLALQTSTDSIVNYIVNVINAVLSSTMSAYDKSEILIMLTDMNTAAMAMRKPFEETTVSPSGKLIAVNQLTVIELQMTRVNSILENYLGAAEEDRELFDVKLNNQKTANSRKRAFKATRAQNGVYREGGARNDFGSNAGRGTVGGGPGPNRSTNPGKTPGTTNRSTGRDTPSARPQGLSRPVGSPSNLRSDSAGSLRAGGNVKSPNQAGPNRGLGGSTASNGSGGVKTGTTTGSTSGGGCFAYGTLFKMADSSLKPIQDIRIGDMMLDGGRVEIVLQGDGYTQDWYNYNGIIVTGSHPVLDTDGEWRRVEDTVIAIPIAPRDTFYSLYNSAQRMIASNGTVFTDFLEVGFQHPLRKKIYGMEAEELIDMLNNKLKADI